MPEWTKAQRAAIETRGRSLLVGAAAGSGKTAVLIGRILSLICEGDSPIPADRLLVVTYTNAAAAELRSRLDLALSEAVAARPNDRALMRQQTLVHRAQIGTIHSFCSALLREFSQPAGIPCDFSICDEIEALELRDQASSRVCDRLLSDPESGWAGFCDLFGRSRSDSAATAALLSFYDFLTMFSSPDDCIDSARRALKRPESGRAADTPVGRELWVQASDCLEGILICANEALKTCELDEIISANCADAISGDLAAAEQLAQLVKAGSWDAAADAARRVKHTSLGRRRVADKETDTRVKALRSRIKESFKRLKELLPCNEEDFFLDSDRMLAALEALVTAEQVFEEAYSELKLRRGLLDFSDLERLTFRLLEDPECRHEVASRYDAVFVDEYQDVNELQDAIFERVAGPGRLFAVGDVKQSIYSFRRADPSIFLARRDRTGDGLYLAMGDNFRSSQAVIESVNRVFDRLMSPRCGGVDYSAERLVPGPGAPEGEQPGLEIHLVEDDTESEAAHIAAVISGMLRDKHPVINRDGSSRPCREGDFCLLMRATKKKASLFRQALAAAGLRSDGDGADGFFEHSEVELALSLLRLIDNRTRDIDAAAVMLSPLFGFTPDELCELRLADRYAGLYTLCCRSDSPRCRELVARLGEWRSLSIHLRPDELLERVLDDTEAELLLTAGEDMVARRDRLRALVDYAADYSEKGGSLPGFLRLCERARANNKSISAPAAPLPDRVSIISIHKSKGLEWPFVFLCDASKSINRQDSSLPPLLFDDRLGIGARIKIEVRDGLVSSHKTPHFTALSRCKFDLYSSEELRVLYVALTRARQKVIVSAPFVGISGAQKALDKAELDRELIERLPSHASRASSLLDWVLAGALEGGEAAALMAGQLDMKGHNCRLLYTAATSAATVSEPEARAPVSITPEELKQLTEVLSYCYPRAALSALPTKLSVSQLSHPDRLPLPPPALAASSRAGGAARGTALHLFMQLADYRLAALSPEKEISRLLSGGYIDQATADLIDRGRLSAFFEGPLGRRLAQANLLREYEFVDAIAAGELAELPSDLAGERVMVQGIADCVIIETDGCVLIDYKSDRVTRADQLLERYGTQLELYRRALDRRLPKPIKQSIIYSFALGQTVEVYNRERPTGGNL